jgi:hypothetical protein
MSILIKIGFKNLELLNCGGKKSTDNGTFWDFFLNIRGMTKARNGWSGSKLV